MTTRVCCDQIPIFILKVLEYQALQVVSWGKAFTVGLQWRGTKVHLLTGPGSRGEVRDAIQF